jgi:malonyl-CoA decarboxylase
MSNAFFSDLMTSIAERGRTLLDRKSWSAAVTSPDVVALCEALLTVRGEASGAKLAREALDAYAQLPIAGKAAFFESLAAEFGPDRERLAKAVADYGRNPDAAAASSLHYSTEPRRQELYRRLNRAPGGASDLVAMRADFLKLFRGNADLAQVDADFLHLFLSWFNPGFLVLRHIDWGTPANILEKIIRYEAVHQIWDWDDLRRRIDPKDRRCYAFFHPALVDEPLIFVEVALTAAMPDNVQKLLAPERAVEAPEKARTAVFYSISNCQEGLAGVSFGNFLIKRVVEELRRELPRLDQFVTLSPAPGFMKWLVKSAESPAGPLEPSSLETLQARDWVDDADKAEGLRQALEPLAAHYFLKAKNAAGRPLDPVARFHLGNGARLERINWLGDISAKGQRESATVMVNYLYDLDEIEKNHEAFADKGEVVSSSAVRKMLRAEGRSLFSRQPKKIRKDLVEPDGIEPTTSSMPLKRSPN